MYLDYLGAGDSVIIYILALGPACGRSSLNTIYLSYCIWTQDSSRFFKEAPHAALKAAGGSFLEEALALMIWILDL